MPFKQLLLVKLKYLDEWHKKHQERAKLYDQLFEDIPLVTPFVEEYNFHIYHQYTIRVKERDKLKEYLRQKGVGTAIYCPLPLHLQECYKYLNYKEGNLPISEKMSKEVLSLPIYPELTESQQRKVVEYIKEFLKKEDSDAIRASRNR
jgi:dTDP-4-amino-4,6-dideoxygalactose transaminase